jgi:hypothetical protein
MGIDWYKVYGSLERFIITLTLPQLIDDDDDDDIDNDSDTDTESDIDNDTWAEGARIITEIETDIRNYIEKYKL